MLLVRGDFARLWWAGLVSMIGSWMLAAALPAHVYLTSQSVPAAAVMFFSTTLPRVVLGSFGGVIADRYDRRLVLVWSNVLAALALLPLLLVAPGALWPAYLSAALLALVTLPIGPAEGALLPRLVGSEHQSRANALNALNNNLARLIGPALGGVVLAVSGLGAVVLLDAFSYVLAAALVALIRPSGGPASGAERTLGTRWREGLQVTLASAPLRTPVLLLGLSTIGEGVFGVLLAPFVTSVLDGDARVYGLILSAQAIGGLLGGVLLARLADRWRPELLLAWGGIGLGIVDLAIFLSPLVVPGAVPALILMILAGAPASAAGAGWATLVQRHAGDAFTGRVYGLAGQFAALCVLLGAGLGGLARGEAGIIAMICIQGIAQVASGAVVLVLARRGVLTLTAHAARTPVADTSTAEPSSA